jgi:chorismate mutase
MSDQSHTLNAALTEFRGQIDAIDDQLMELLLARCEIVKQVGKLKERNHVSGSFIRPKRESDMIKRIVGFFEGTDFPPESAAHIWRTIIGTSLRMESPLNTAVHCPNGSLVPFFFARDFFGGTVPSAVFPTAQATIEATENNPHTVAIINQNDVGDIKPWWLHIALSEHKLRIFTCIPFVQKLTGSAAQNPFLAIGHVDCEATGDDISYLVAHFDTPYPTGNAKVLVDKWLELGDFRGSTVATIEQGRNGWSCLIKLQGYACPVDGDGSFSDIQQHIGQCSDGSLDNLYFIGAHAMPCLIED